MAISTIGTVTKAMKRIADILVLSGVPTYLPREDGLSGRKDRFVDLGHVSR